MRVVVTAPSVFGERAIATVAELSAAGHEVAACIALRTADRAVLRRKLAQLGPTAFVRYAWQRLTARRSSGGAGFQNRHIARRMAALGRSDRTLRDTCDGLGVELLVVDDVNGPAAVEAATGADVVVYTGGGILRPPLIRAPRLGVLNAHAGLLPEYRGMNVAPWSLFRGDPVAITAHFIDPGIDTGRILDTYEVDIAAAASLADLTDRIADRSIDVFVDALAQLEAGAQGQAQAAKDGRQYFVMHDTLRALAERRLAAISESDFNDHPSEQTNT